MPFHGAYRSYAHGDHRLILAWAVLTAFKKVPRDSVLLEPLRRIYRGLFDSHFNDVEWLTPSLMVNTNPAKRQCTICGPHGLFSLGLMRVHPARGSNNVMFADNTLAMLNPFIALFAKVSDPSRSSRSSPRTSPLSAPADPSLHVDPSLLLIHARLLSPRAVRRAVRPQGLEERHHRGRAAQGPARRAGHRRGLPGRRAR
jgi:hypothetical protein